MNAAHANTNTNTKMITDTDTTTATKPAKKKTARQVVTQNLEALRGLNAAGLFQFSRENGFDSRAGFPAFKRALLEQGIDYAAIRDGARAAKAEALAIAARRHNIELCMEWIPGTENPADKFTTASGYKSWKDCDLAALATKIEKEGN